MNTNTVANLAQKIVITIETNKPLSLEAVNDALGELAFSTEALPIAGETRNYVMDNLRVSFAGTNGLHD